MTDNERLDLEAVGRLLRLAENLGLTELDVAQNGQRVTIRCRTGPAGTLVPSAHLHDGVLSDEPHAHWASVRAPMVGVFYRAASPDAPPFVEPGDRVERGQTVGMIEAMKVFSEIPCEFSGVVERVMVDNGTLVRPDDVLLYISADA